MLRIVTDSTADIPLEQAREVGVRIVPLKVFFGDECYRDWVELTPEQFYEKLKSSPVMPRTSQPSPEDFLDTYRQFHPGDEIISIHISRQLSGTLQSAELAQKMLPEREIQCFDSLQASVGLRLQVLEAARAAKEGCSKEEVLRLLKHYRDHSRVYFVVDTLEYLHKNGRIGKAKTLLGGLLKVKPLLCLEQGVIGPVEQARGWKKAVQRLIELMEADLSGAKAIKALVAHAVVPEEAEKIKAEIQERLQPREITTASIGAVIGSHVGPGVVGIVAAPAFEP
ncbi:MAG: DegV family protein [Dethiobacteria bacterium]